MLPVIRFNDDDDIVARANNSPYGLGASIWSSDTKRARALAERMDVGMVGINQHVGVDANVPFGGSKQSGIGTELGREGLLEFTRLQVITLANRQHGEAVA